ATVAASSLGMKIRDPRPLLARVDPTRWERILGRAGRPLPAIATSEPEVRVAAPAPAAGAASTQARPPLAGRIQRVGDQVVTDAIIPGEFWHLTKLEDLGAKAFAFVRPEFVARVAAGQDVVVAGEAWGSGSSREQAVWALQGAGVRAVIAKSFAFIHKRNLGNEALPFLVVPDAEFYERAVDGAEVSIDFSRSEVQVGGVAYRARGATPMIQALTRAGGLVPAILRHGGRGFSPLTDAPS